LTPSFCFHRATPLGEGGVALFELYGDGAAKALREVFRPKGGFLPEEGEARLGSFLDGSGSGIDDGILSRVPARGSWSRLDAWTLSVHGGLWIQANVTLRLKEMGGSFLETAGILRLALEKGVMDAVEAAAYELLLEARTEKAARFFLRQYGGELSARLREGLSIIDQGRLGDALRMAEDLVSEAGPAFRLGHPLKVLIAGRPNAGKSTLFNRLVERERAVVTPVPGTTRDTLEELIQIDGYPVSLADGAGLRALESAGEIEREGIKRVLERKDDAVLYLFPHPWEWTALDHEFVQRFPRRRSLLLASLADLNLEGREPDADVTLSALKGKGLEELRREILVQWIDPRGPGRKEISPAPFTRSQVEILSRGLELAGELPGGLDALRSAFVECLGSSWPESGRY
jgi:tRNA modification GTPase